MRHARTGNIDGRPVPGDGAKLCRLSLQPKGGGYFRCADAVKKELVWRHHLSAPLAGYAVDSVSYALGVTYSEKSCADLNVRLTELVLSAASAGSVPEWSVRSIISRTRDFIRRLTQSAAAGRQD